MKKIFMNVALVGAMLMGNAVSASAQVDLGSLGSAIGSVIDGNKTSDSKGGIVNSLVSVISGDKAALHIADRRLSGCFLSADRNDAHDNGSNAEEE
jgi:hypothetical protein